MHRVRVGLIGPAANSTATANDSAPSEPLAELGVAPGNPDQDDSKTRPPAKTRAPAH
jgi:hypothetical protein